MTTLRGGQAAMGAIVNLDHSAHTVHWHFFQMSVANVVVIVVMLAVFALAVVLPKRLHAQSEPAYAASWIYVFGVSTVAALGVVIASGAVLSLKGPEWWHYTGVGHFFNSMHLWAVELFFFSMVIHLWGKFWMAAWRGGRTTVWVTGAISFLVSIPAALTGYLSQQNFDAQWIAIQAKDAMNSIGAGAFFNVTNFGQMYSYHVLLLPLAVVALAVAHVLLVRRHGLAPPMDLQARLESSRESTDESLAGSVAEGSRA